MALNSRKWGSNWRIQGSIAPKCDFKPVISLQSYNCIVTTCNYDALLKHWWISLALRHPSLDKHINRLHPTWNPNMFASAGGSSSNVAIFFASIFDSCICKSLKICFTAMRISRGTRTIEHLEGAVSDLDLDDPVVWIGLQIPGFQARPKKTSCILFSGSSNNYLLGISLYCVYHLHKWASNK